MNSLWALCLLFTVLCYWEWIGRLHASQFLPKKLELCSFINSKRSLSFAVLFIHSEFLITLVTLPIILSSHLHLHPVFLSSIFQFKYCNDNIPCNSSKLYHILWIFVYIVIYISTTQIYLLLKLIHNYFLWIMFDTVTYYKVLKAGAMLYILWKNIITQ